MESNNVIIGYKLNEIQKKPDEVKLVFENSKTKKVYTFTFKGFLFETSPSIFNKKVKQIQLNDTLGFRATTQLRRLNRNPENYRQLFIQMEGTNDDNKLELVGALRNYNISLQKKTPVTDRTVSTNKKKAAI